MLRAVVFDAVGTLLVPNPPVAEVYGAVGRRYGSRYRVEQLRGRFAQAFAIEEALDRAAGWVTDEGRELRRWRDIVARVLDDVADPDGCFTDLYEHFARPTSWICVPGAGSLLAELRRIPLKTAIASNFDHRLLPIVQGLPKLAGLDGVFVSSALGWRKPAREFFEAVVRGLDVRAEEVLYVGDDPTNDLHGATEAGMRAVLFDRKIDDIREAVRSIAGLPVSRTSP
ncbi:MAG TPA: HAD-IA family hydrolase [Gemmataceae bacterium]|jgi:putative hydrolase of the HAD superfamily|nr:HAD-IA family hydrolase [Gemmataceae bacterium]